MATKLEDWLWVLAIAGGVYVLWRVIEDSAATEAEHYDETSQGTAQPGAGEVSPGGSPLVPSAPPGDALPFPAQSPAPDISSAILNAVIPQQVSEAGEAFIKHQEGLTLTPKPDSKGGRVIGRGHYLAPGDPWQGSITLDQADAVFENDLGEAESLVHQTVSVALSQNQFDALTDLAFNVPAAFGASSTLLKVLNAGNYQAAAAEILRWNKADGKTSLVLTKRRKSEAQAFNPALSGAQQWRVIRGGRAPRF